MSAKYSAFSPAISCDTSSYQDITKVLKPSEFLAIAKSKLSFAEMDIFNRPPAISEDTLIYRLYPPEDTTDKASATALAVSIQNYAESILPDMQWHRDSFELKVAKDSVSNSHIVEGRMRVGDCVDDEWCAVYLLREISKKWDVAIRVHDSDGEFLLIEAADYLPSWVAPKNAVNRVWIYRARIHLVPLVHISLSSNRPHGGLNEARNDFEDDDEIDYDEYITEMDALNLVRAGHEDTVAVSGIEQAIWRRVDKYPAAARDHVHHTNAMIPVDVARALAINPGLVQKAVQTFYTRDALQLRAAHRMSRFPPDTSVLATVKMSRTAYAQLMGQKFHPPKSFGRWTELEGTPEWRRKDVGMKIACGFEMLYQESSGRTVNRDGQGAKLTNYDLLRQNPDYQDYIRKLDHLNYFQGELRGSQLWSEREFKAAAAFVDVRRADDRLRLSFAEQVEHALSIASSPSAVVSEDPDDWLTVNAEDIDSMLLAATTAQDPKRTNQPDDEEDRIVQEQASRLKSLSEKVGQFVEDEGDLEGARFADELLEEDGDSDSAFDSDDEDSDMRVEDDEREQQRRQAALDALVPGLTPSEYGQMPASFHKNSQRVNRTATTNVPEDVSETENSHSRPIRPPILPRDRYEGADSDDGSDEDEEDTDSEDDRPQVVGEIEIDMEDEQDEFLEFARHALGMSDEQWRDIVNERKARGAFVPDHVTFENKSQSQNHASTPGERARLARGESSGNGSGQDLDSFENVMQAMDAELARKSERVRARSTQNPDVPDDPENNTMDIEAAMEAELTAHLEAEEEDVDLDGPEKLDYNLIKNFLESFKSQAGLSGPVSNLVGRLQPAWGLPRDAS